MIKNVYLTVYGFKSFKSSDYSHWSLSDTVTNYYHLYFNSSYTYVTLDHKTSLKSLGYICSKSQKYIVWVKIIDFSFISAKYCPIITSHTSMEILFIQL